MNLSRGEEDFGRDVKAKAEALDVSGVQLSLAGENFGDYAFPAEVRSDVALFQAVLFREEPYEVGWRSLGYFEVLFFVAFDEQDQQFDGFYLGLGRIWQRGELVEGPGVGLQLLLRAD